MDTQRRDPLISFTDREVYACPFPVYDRLREEQPVYRDPKSGHYILTRYDDVRKALLNVAALSNNTGVMGDRWAPEANRLFETEGWLPITRWCPTTHRATAPTAPWSTKYSPRRRSPALNRVSSNSSMN